MKSELRPIEEDSKISDRKKLAAAVAKGERRAAALLLNHGINEQNKLLMSYLITLCLFYKTTQTYS